MSARIVRLQISTGGRFNEPSAEMDNSISCRHFRAYNNRIIAYYHRYLNWILVSFASRGRNLGERTYHLVMGCYYRFGSPTSDTGRYLCLYAVNCYWWFFAFQQ